MLPRAAPPLRAIRKQFIPYSWDARNAASLGRPILQELLLDVDALVDGKQFEVCTELPGTCVRSMRVWIV